jgi:agmatinase
VTLEVGEGERRSTDLLAELLRLSPHLALESTADDGVVVYNGRTSRRLRLSRPTYELLLRFHQPTSLLDLVPERGGQELRPWVERLLQAGVLERVDGPFEVPERRLRPVPRTLFHCPSYRAGAPAADVSVVGVPYEWGNRGALGMRQAPVEIRARSSDFEYRLDVRTGRPLGWFDVSRGARILEGCTIDDRGDVWFMPGEDPRGIHRRIREVCGEILDAGSFPLVLGGDQSIALPVVDALQTRRDLAVLYLDAHTDFAELGPGGTVNHTNVARAIHSLQGVAMLVQVGHRGYTVSDKLTRLPPGLGRVSTEQLRNGGPGCVLDLLPEGVPCYVSIDVNCLDPAHAPGTSLPAPGGLTPEQVKEVLRAVAGRHRLVGMDLVEVNPSRDVGWLTLITACHLLLAGLGAAADSRTAV